MPVIDATSVIEVGRDLLVLGAARHHVRLEADLLAQEVDLTADPFVVAGTACAPKSAGTPKLAVDLFPLDEVGSELQGIAALLKYRDGPCLAVTRSQRGIAKPMSAADHAPVPRARPETRHTGLADQNAATRPD